MADAAGTLVPILVIGAVALFMWYKLREPLGHFWEWIKGMLSGGKERTVQTVQTTKEIVYDI